MKISEEWAKQLAFEVIGHDLPFAAMRAAYIHGSPALKYRIPIYPSMVSGIAFDLEFEVVELQRIFDPVNSETTWIGYGARTNTLVIGETRALPET
jgi:hypothetical protein